MFGETQIELHPRCSRDRVVGCFLAVIERSRARLMASPWPSKIRRHSPRIYGRVEGNRILGLVSPAGATVSFNYEVEIVDEDGGVCVQSRLRPRWEPHAAALVVVALVFAAEAIFRFSIFPKGPMADYGMLIVFGVITVNFPMGSLWGVQAAEDVVRAAVLGRIDGQALWPDTE